jgi:hypothetical protein
VSNGVSVPLLDSILETLWQFGLEECGMVRRCVEIASGIASFAAAALWFAAGWRVNPPFVWGYSVVPSPDMPAFQKWRRAGVLNQWAAVMAGLAAMLSSIALSIPEK